MDELIKILNNYPVPTSVVTTILIIAALSKFVFPHASSAINWINKPKEEQITNLAKRIEELDIKYAALEEKLRATEQELAKTAARENQLLGGQKEIVSNQDSIRIEVMESKEQDKTNTDRIVDAILSLKKAEAKTVAPKAVKVAPKREIVIERSVVRSKASPGWDLNGSMSDAYNKSKLVNHLSTNSNHRRIQAKYTRSQLNAMSIGQLWTLHDNDHEGKSIGTRDVIPINPSPPVTWEPNDPCPGGVCPGGTRSRSFSIRRSRPVIFPNAWWNR